MTTKQITTLVRISATSILRLAALSAIVLVNTWAFRALAQDGHSHTPSADQQNDAGTLLKVVRESTERFKDVSVAQAEGYALQFGCVSGSDSGAMGLHYVNGNLVNSGMLDAT